MGRSLACDDAPMEGRFVRHSRRVAYENAWITVWHDEVSRPDGSPGIYGVVHFGNLAAGVVALDDDDRIMLVGQHRYTLDRESWEIPEGGVPPTETALEGIQRELREETGLEIEPQAFVGVWMEPDYDGRTVLCLTWDARVTGGTERAADDVSELAWFAPDELPADGELAFRHFPELLGLWRARHEHT